MNLFKRVALAIALPLLILLGALAFQTIGQYRQEGENIREQDQIRVEAILERLDSLEKELQKAASLIAESKDSSRAVDDHDLDYLYDWSRLFHSNLLNRVIITDEEGTVLTRSYDRFRFSDSLSHELSIGTALGGTSFWGLAEVDGFYSLAYSRPVRLYNEIPVGTVTVCAGSEPELLAYLTDSTLIDLEIGPSWPLEGIHERNRPPRAVHELDTPFDPPVNETDKLRIVFYESAVNRREIEGSMVILLLIMAFILLSLLLVYRVLSNYVRPYSDLVDSISLLTHKQVDFSHIRDRLIGVEKGRNGEAARIASAFSEFTYVIEKDISHLEDSANRDALTGLRNRRYALKRLDWEYWRHRNEKSDLCLIMADIDRFKLINDLFGHPFGDEILVMVAGIFSRICRGTDVTVRWGGEEFMVICPFTSSLGCHILAEKIRDTVEKEVVPRLREKARELGIGLPDDASPMGTMSLGCALVKDHDQENPAYEEADKALYRAKKTRNRVV